ncbi:MAG TPA: tRNA (guanosine(46)-N7)-methyltransferase TrmB [Caulobacteraceae bacterium]|nr:tRNA (guanosine(46)-N7)-methyltransferase TrmB [Caulobacteraceae bacterium]
MTPIRTYGRTKSRTLKPAQAALVDELLPRLAIPASPFDPMLLMPGAREVWLEIGFGGGEHLAGQAEAHPDVLFLGAEPFLNGVASALRHVDVRGLGNVRLHHGDGRELMARLPDGAVRRLFLLFPDPWPKTRHHKRRLVNAAFAAEAARILAGGGRLTFATDWSDYAHEALAILGACPALAWTAERADDWRRPPAGHVATRYEAKRLGDCAPVWLEFERRPPGSIFPSS